MPASKTVSTKQVFQKYAKKTSTLTLRKLDRSTVLVEGDRDGLEFLGRLLIACAKSKEHSVQLSPKGAGASRFTKKSTLGVYIHKLPCYREGSHLR